MKLNLHGWDGLAAADASWCCEARVGGRNCCHLNYTSGAISPRLTLHGVARRPELMKLNLHGWDGRAAADASWCCEARVGGRN